MSSHGRLTPMQDAVLEAFFASERDFFLSGGAALVGFHLHHRETTDLDLFTASAEAFDRAKVVLPNALKAVGMTVVVKHDAPGFRRVVVKSGSEELVVDLVGARSKGGLSPQHSSHFLAAPLAFGDSRARTDSGRSGSPRFPWVAASVVDRDLLFQGLQGLGGNRRKRRFLACLELAPEM